MQRAYLISLTVRQRRTRSERPSIVEQAPFNTREFPDSPSENPDLCRRVRLGWQLHNDSTIAS
jgi:hypothetical protein